MLKTISSFVLVALSLYAQNPVTAQFPGNIATDANLLVASNNAQSVLTGAINSSVTSFSIAVGTNFIAPTALTVEKEIVICQSLSGGTYSGCARGAQGTTAVSHQTGAPVYENMQAIFPNSTNAEIKAIETALGTNFSGGGTTSQTTSRGLVATDNGTLIAFNGSSLTATLPNPPPSAKWTVRIVNLNASSLTVSPNSLTINGSGSSITLAQFQSVTIYTDSFNYFQTSTPPGAGNIAIGATVSSGTACGVLSVGSGPVLQQDPSYLCYYVATHNFSVGGNVAAGYRLDVQSSGTNGTFRLFDQTPTTGVTSITFQAGAAQTSNDILKMYNYAGSIQFFGIDADGAFYVRDLSGNKAAAMSAYPNTVGGGVNLGSQSIVTWKSVPDLDSAGTIDTGLSRIGAGNVGVGNGIVGDTSGTLQLNNIITNGCTGCGNSTGISATAGTGGVTINLLAAKDASAPTRFVLPATGGCGAGFAGATATVGNAFTLFTAAGSSLTGIADNAVTAGHLLIGGSATPGRVADSGFTSRASLSTTTCIVGVALTSATTGSTVTVLYDGVGSFGTLQGSAAYTLCASGCSTTIPTSFPFNVTASTHGQGVNATVTCLDNTGTQLLGTACGATEPGLTDGNFTFNPAVAPAKILIR